MSTIATIVDTAGNAGGGVRELVLGGKRVSDETDCFVIAEIGHNHQGSLEKARELFRIAKDCGVDAVKLQKRDNRMLFTRAFFDSPYDNENSFGPTYGLHREALELGGEEWRSLVAHAADLELTLVAAAFDPPSAEFLQELGVPVFKIASADIVNVPLLRQVAAYGKPIILSTGGASIDDVDRAVQTILPLNRQLCILQCTSAYPVDIAELNLRVITSMRERYPELVIGLSDHQDGISMSLVAYMLGARVIEKHFTLSHALKGTDHAFSLMPEGMRKLVRDLRRAPVALGDGVKRRYPSEEGPLRKMGKNLVAAHALSAGHVLAAEDLAIKSPAAGGLPPYELETLVGRRLARALTAEEAVTVDVLEPVAQHETVAAKSA